MPPPLTTKEADQMLRVKLASKHLYKENIPVCTTPTLPTKEIDHK